MADGLDDGQGAADGVRPGLFGCAGLRHNLARDSPLWGHPVFFSFAWQSLAGDLAADLQLRAHVWPHGTPTPLWPPTADLLTFNPALLQYLDGIILLILIYVIVVRVDNVADRPLPIVLNPSLHFLILDLLSPANF